MMQRKDLDELRARFAALDLNDLDALKNWFTSQPHLSVNDHAQIAQKTSQYIGMLRRKVGIRGKTPKFRPRTLALPKSLITVPEDWRTNPEWLAKAVQLYSLQHIAKSIPLDRSGLTRVLARHGIKWKSILESVRSKNPCCTHAWCYQHYVEMCLTQEECAKLAGCAQQTFTGWLNRFNIPVRDVSQNHHRKKFVLVWERELAYKLRQQPTVRRVFVRDNHVHVRYRNYFWETYYSKLIGKPKRRYTYFKILAHNTQLEKVPLVYPQFGTDIDGTPLFPAHIAISKTDLKKASILEKRVALHEFARQIVTRGWVWPSFPDDMLREDFERVKIFNVARYLENGGFTAIPKHVRIPPGRKLMMHFFDLSSFWEILKKPSKTVRFLNAVLNSTVQFNFFNLMLTAAANEGKVLRKAGEPQHLPDPVVYHAIFQRLKLTGTLLDVNVGFGNRAIACAAYGLTYTTPDPAFAGVIDRGFLDFTGLNYVPYDGQKVDIVLYDEGFKPPIMSKVLPYLNKATRLMVFAPPSHKEEVLKYNPTTAIRVRTRFYSKIPGYLFIW